MTGGCADGARTQVDGLEFKVVWGGVSRTHRPAESAGRRSPPATASLHTMQAVHITSVPARLRGAPACPSVIPPPLSSKANVAGPGREEGADCCPPRRRPQAGQGRVTRWGIAAGARAGMHLMSARGPAGPTTRTDGVPTLPSSDLLLLCLSDLWLDRPDDSDGPTARSAAAALVWPAAQQARRLRRTDFQICCCCARAPPSDGRISRSAAAALVQPMARTTRRLGRTDCQICRSCVRPDRVPARTTTQIDGLPDLLLLRSAGPRPGRPDDSDGWIWELSSSHKQE
jgi:hypothetical protein